MCRMHVHQYGKASRRRKDVEGGVYSEVRSGSKAMCRRSQRGVRGCTEPMAMSCSATSSSSSSLSSDVLAVSALDELKLWADCAFLRFTSRIKADARAAWELHVLEKRHGLSPMCVLACLRRALVVSEPGDDGRLVLLYAPLTTANALEMRADSTRWRSKVRAAASRVRRALRAPDGSGPDAMTAAILLGRMATDLETACEDVEAASIAGGMALERAGRAPVPELASVLARPGAEDVAQIEGVCVPSFLGNFATYAATCGELLEEGEEQSLLILARAAHPRSFRLETSYAGEGEDRFQIVEIENERGISAEAARNALDITVTRRVARARDQLRRAKRYHTAREKFWEHKLVFNDARNEYGRVRRRMKRARRAYSRARKSVRREWR